MNTIENELGTELYKLIDETIQQVQSKEISLEVYDKRFQSFKTQMEISDINEGTRKTIDHLYHTIRRHCLGGNDARWGESN